MRVASRTQNFPAVQPSTPQATRSEPQQPAASSAAPGGAAASADAYAAGREPSVLAKVGAFTKGALAGAVASPVAVAVLGCFALGAVGVSPFGAVGVAAMATLKSCVVGAAWVGGALNGLAELEDLKSSQKPASTQDA